MGRSYGEARNGDRCASTFACLSTSADSFAHHSRRAEANVGSAIQWRLRTGVGRKPRAILCTPWAPGSYVDNPSRSKYSMRSEAGRVGKEGYMKCRSGWVADH